MYRFLLEGIDCGREKGGWLDISLYTTRGVNRSGVHTDGGYEDAMNQWGNKLPSDMELPSEQAAVGARFPSALGFRPA